MNKELQDLAWSVLPKEFKEEVKKMRYNKDFTNEQKTMIRLLFGDDNLASDAEGEEMLTVPRKKVQEMYTHYDAISTDPDRPKDYIESVYEYADGVTMALDDLFGSKCLPENVDSSKPNVDSLGGNVDSLEPGFKSGDVAVISSEFKHPLIEQGGAIVTILSYHPNGDFYSCAIAPNVGIDVDAKYLEPYTEPKENIAESRKTSQNCDKEFDNILKDSFSKERRLNIAVTILGNIIQSGYYSLSEKYCKENMSEMAKLSLQLTDALIVATKSATERIP